MKTSKNLPVFNISNFYDYNECMDFDNNFYVRKFNDHIKENCFIEKPHGHDFFLMLLITKGSGKHIIDFHEYKIEPGAMFILSPGQVHQWQLSPDTDGYVLFFTKKYFLQDFNIGKLVKLPFFKPAFSIPYLKLEASTSEMVGNIYKQIIAEYQSHLIDYHQMIRIYLNAMLIELTRVYSIAKTQGIAYNYELLQLHRYESLIDCHFKEHKGLNFYTESMNLSSKQLSYLCKKVVNKTPSEMLMERIILEAKRLLIHSHLSISTIAETLNYNDNSYFIRIFKKYNNQTPEQFRNTFSSQKIVLSHP